MTTYTRADPYLAFSGKVGDVDDELGLARVLDTSRNALITWSATGGPDGDGGWKYLGGNSGGDCCRDTDESSYPMSTSEAWAQMRFKLNVVPSVTGKYVIMVAVTTGDTANFALLKPCIKIDQAGVLYLGNTNNTTNDTSLYTPTIGTVYTILLHAVGGASGSLTQEAFIYSSTGALLASVSVAWAIGNTASNDVVKWGNSGGGNTTSLDFDFAHMVAWKGLSTNPGPCKVYALRATSVVAAGNFTAVGAADIPTAISENNSAARSITDLTSTSASTAISTAAAELDTALDVGARISNHAGVTNVGRSIASVASTTSATLDSSTGVSSSAGTAATIQRRGHDADTSYADVNNATASTLELALSDASIPSGDTIHTVIVVANMRYVTSSPTVQLGIKSAGTSSLMSPFPAISTGYNRRRNATSVAATAPSQSLDPATSAQWTTSAIDAMTMLIRDNDALAREFRVTNAHVLVIAAQAGGTAATASLADNAAATDVLTRGGTYARALAEGAAAADALAARRALGVSLADNAIAGDALTRALGEARALAEQAAAADTVARAETAARAISDGAAAPDVLGRGALIQARLLGDTAAAPDVLVGATGRVLAESALAADILARQTTAARILAEIADAGDVLGPSTVQARLLAESALASDALAAHRGSTVMLVDSATATAVIVRVVLLARSLVDAAFAVDVLHVSGSTSTGAPPLIVYAVRAPTLTVIAVR